MLCESYNCKDSLTAIANNLENRTYKVVPKYPVPVTLADLPSNPDFEKPAIEAISAQNVVYDETQDHSDDTLEKISHYLTNTDNEHCPINTCKLMENCHTSTPTVANLDQNGKLDGNIWAPTSQEIIAMAAQNADWATVAGSPA